MNALPPQMLSPLDSRYRAVVAPIGLELSEAALNRERVRIEIEWLIALASRRIFGVEPIREEIRARLRAIPERFGQADIDELAAIEATTRHDVKAVEYYVRRRVEEAGLGPIVELVHFGCTSEDINNTAYACTVRRAVQEVWLPRARGLVGALAALARDHRDLPMLALTHGQPATPTTLGKELAVFVRRLGRRLESIAAQEYLGKWAGATGNFAAHRVAAPEVDWPEVAREFLAGLGLAWNPLTTQIEPHDWQAELYDEIVHCNRILHNLATDIWMYISRGVFTQIPQPGATGSSTMPHKINPIRFENAESNLELSDAVLGSLSRTLVTTRLQRDLTDSSAQRNIGVGLGHSLLAIDNLQRGLEHLAVNRAALAAELDANWEVLAEAIQTVLRAEIVAGRSTIRDPYAQLKAITRGHRIERDALRTFVEALDIGDAAKARLLALTPAAYTGDSAALVDHIGE